MLRSVMDLMMQFFMMAALGYFLKKKKIIDDTMQKGLSNLLLKAIVPFSILASSNNAFSKEMSKSILGTAIIAGCFYIFAILVSYVISRHLNINENKKKIFLMGNVFSNQSFIGFPIAQELLGYGGLLCAVIFNLYYNLFFFTLGIQYISGKKKFDIRAMFTNFLLIVSIVSIIIYFSPFRFPKVVFNVFSRIGSMNLPISMMIIGCNIADSNVASILKDKTVYLISLMRLIIFPLVVLFVGRALGGNVFAIKVCTVMAALPVGTLNVLLAEEQNCEPKFAAAAVVQSMVLMCISLPIIVLIMNTILK